MSEEDLADFYKIKDKLINSEALASPDFLDLDKYPLIMALDFSVKAMCVTISQVQKCLDGQFQEKTALLFREEMFSVRTKLVVTSWGVSHVRKGTRHLCLAAQASALFGGN